LEGKVGTRERRIGVKFVSKKERQIKSCGPGNAFSRIRVSRECFSASFEWICDIAHLKVCGVAL
jgi:uncharacterized membrane protein YbhN (UPF0104 family)